MNRMGGAVRQAEAHTTRAGLEMWLVVIVSSLLSRCPIGHHLRCRLVG